MLWIGVFVVVGTPLVYYLWTVVNELLAGRVRGGHLVAAVPVLGLFFGLLYLLARSVRRWDAEPIE